MALGITISSGPWLIRQFDTNSSATFLKGSAVVLNGARQLVEYASTNSGVLGIALQDSANSLPSGKVLVAVPRAGCTAIADVAPGITSSGLSAGEALGLGKRGNYMSFVTTAAASVWSRVWHVAGTIDSATSRIEMAFIGNAMEFWSNSSESIV